MKEAYDDFSGAGLKMRRFRLSVGISDIDQEEVIPPTIFVTLESGAFCICGDSVRNCWYFCCVFS